MGESDTGMVYACQRDLGLNEPGGSQEMESRISTRVDSCALERQNSAGTCLVPCATGLETKVTSVFTASVLTGRGACCTLRVTTFVGMTPVQVKLFPAFFHFNTECQCIRRYPSWLVVKGSARAVSHECRAMAFITVKHGGQKSNTYWEPMVNKLLVDEYAVYQSSRLSNPGSH